MSQANPADMLYTYPRTVCVIHCISHRVAQCYLRTFIPTHTHTNFDTHTHIYTHTYTHTYDTLPDDRTYDDGHRHEQEVPEFGVTAASGQNSDRYGQSNGVVVAVGQQFGLEQAVVVLYRQTHVAEVVYL